MIDFKCQCCNLECGNAYSLNKHLSTCPKYDEWIKTYNPPTLEYCKTCNVYFKLGHKCKE